MNISGEFQLIEKIRGILGPPSKSLKLGIGDDCAVIEPSFSGKILATVDAQVEGVHFDLKYITPFELGHRALAVNLSDIAAMGGEPRYAMVSLGLRPEIGDEFVLELFRGLKALAERFGVEVVGGNTTRASQIFIDISLIGESGGQWLERKGAKVGDLVVVTGALGGSALGLAVMRKFGRHPPENIAHFVLRHLKPEPRILDGRVLARCGSVGALIDISDGLSSEAHHLAKSSGVGIVIEEKLLPTLPLAREACQETGISLEEAILFGGEDYELLFTVRPEGWSELKAALPLAVIIGHVDDLGAQVRLQRINGKCEDLPAKGWDHFSG